MYFCRRKSTSRRKKTKQMEVKAEITMEETKQMEVKTPTSPRRAESLCCQGARAHEATRDPAQALGEWCLSLHHRCLRVHRHEANAGARPQQVPFSGWHLREQRTCPARQQGIGHFQEIYGKHINLRGGAGNPDRH